MDQYEVSAPQRLCVLSFCLAGNLQNRHGGVRECLQKVDGRENAYSASVPRVPFTKHHLPRLPAATFITAALLWLNSD